MGVVVFVFLLLACHYATCRPSSEEESVVSVYTTQATTATATGLDVYHQIANNLAERITSPIYRFLGISKNKTAENTTKKPWGKIELLDEDNEETTKTIQAVDNALEERDIEELSIEALKKEEKKPEKITLFSNYLPLIPKLDNLELNKTINEIPEDEDDDDFNFDDLENQGRGENPFYFILEWFGSIWQLIYGAFSAIFGSREQNNDDSKKEFVF